MVTLYLLYGLVKYRDEFDVLGHGKQVKYPDIGEPKPPRQEQVEVRAKVAASQET
jgi:hypothetical protein